jgi:hypothetical protein
MYCVDSVSVSSSVPKPPKDGSRCPSRRVRFLDPPHEVNEFCRYEEREKIWWQASDRQEAIHDVLHDSQECLLQDRQSAQVAELYQVSFADTYLAVYQLCHALSDVSVDSATVEEQYDLSRICGPEVITLLAVCRPLARGIEGRIVPHVALLRHLVRVESIRSIINLHHQLITTESEELLQQQEADEHIRFLSLSLSRPSRMLASIFGLADEAAAKAYHAYSCSTSSNNKQSLDGGSTISGRKRRMDGTGAYDAKTRPTGECSVA